MSDAARTSVLPVRVEFGHCDPAGIVWYPNFYEWFDAASHRLAERAGDGLHALRARLRARASKRSSYGHIDMPEWANP